MPGRVATVAILAFWLVMTSWLTVRELWQRYGTRPRLRDTLRVSADRGPVLWDIFDNDEPLGWAKTEVRFLRRSGEYRLEHRVFLRRIFNLEELFGQPLSLRIRSRVDVSVFGDLRELVLHTAVEDQLLTCRLRARPSGDGRLQVFGSLRFMDHEYNDSRLIDYEGKDLVLNSLCPVDRMPGLRPGQRWQSPMVDPIETILSQAWGQGEMLSPLVGRTMARVAVLDEPDGLFWDDGFVTCHVVESKQGDRTLRVWVSVDDSRVLQQPAELGTIRPVVIRVVRRPPGQRPPTVAGAQPNPKQPAQLPEQ